MSAPIHIDDIEARLKGPPRHVVIGEPTKREARYIVAGVFAALVAVLVIVGMVS